MPRNNLWLSLALGQDPRQNAQQGPQQPRLAPELGALDQNAPRSRQLAARDSLLARPMPNQSTLHDNSWTGRSLQLWDTQVSALRNLDPVQKAEHWGNLALGIAAGAGFGGSATPALNTFNLPEVQPTDFWPAMPAAPGRIGPNPGDVGGITSNHALTAQQSWLRQQAQQAGPHDLQFWSRALMSPGLDPLVAGGKLLSPQQEASMLARPQWGGDEHAQRMRQQAIAAGLNFGPPDPAPSGPPLTALPAMPYFPARSWSTELPDIPSRTRVLGATTTSPTLRGQSAGPLPGDNPNVFHMPYMGEPQQAPPALDQPEAITAPYNDPDVSPANLRRPAHRDAALSFLRRIQEGDPAFVDFRPEELAAISAQLDPLLAPDRFPDPGAALAPTAPENRRGAQNVMAVTNDIPAQIAKKSSYLGEESEGFWDPETKQFKLLNSAHEATRRTFGPDPEVDFWEHVNPADPASPRMPKGALPMASQGTIVNGKRTYTQKPYNVAGTSITDAHFVKPEDYKHRFGKDLINLDLPLTPQHAARLHERIQSLPENHRAQVVALASNKTAIANLMRNGVVGPDLRAARAALQSGVIPTDIPSRAVLDLLNDLTPNTNGGTAFFRKLGINGGYARTRTHTPPPAPGIAKLPISRKFNRPYLRLFDPPKPEIPQPAEVSGQPKRPFDMTGQPDAGGIPWDRRGFNSDRLFNPRTDEEAQHNIKRLGQALSVGRHFVPEFAKRSLVPPEIRGVLHFLGGSGKPTDLGLTPADFEGVGVAPITFSGDMVPALKNASRRLVEHDPAIKRETLIPWVPNPNAVGDAHAYSKLFNTFGKGFFTPEGHAVDDYRFYPNVVETSPRSAYHTSLQELRDALKTHMAPTASLADELFVNRGRPYKLEVRNAIQPQEIELWPNMLDIMQDARARGRHARDYWRSALPQDISDEEDAAITAAFKAQLQNEDPDFDF